METLTDSRIALNDSPPAYRAGQAVWVVDLPGVVESVRADGLLEVLIAGAALPVRLAAVHLRERGTG